MSAMIIKSIAIYAVISIVMNGSVIEPVFVESFTTREAALSMARREREKENVLGSQCLRVNVTMSASEEDS